MPKFHDTLATYLTRLEKVKGRMGKSIVVSKDIKMAPLKGQKGVKRVPIAWPLHPHNMFYTVTVPPKTHIKRHSHNEHVFRYVTKGSLVINGEIALKEGMWFVVKANTPYDVKTDTGYTVIAGYTEECDG
jgi:quercetin dioxygenase-like cupin family protein